MSGLLFRLARPVLRRLDPERAHGLALAGLRAGLYRRAFETDPPALATEAFGLRFANPLGLAAGFDKNAQAPDAMLAQGLGFVEVGTVTPRPQAGNPRPRLFRLEADRAVINRMGFNNEGHARVAARLRARVNKTGRSGIVGVNLGANKDSADRISDYCSGLDVFAGLADYFTVNVSSPNTPGLRDLQAGDVLDTLCRRLIATRDRLGIETPFLIKIAPDLEDDALKAICDVALERGFDGLIVTNTTTARPALRSPHAGEAGGLSGRPLFGHSTRMLARAFQHTKGALPLIGAGGVSSGATAYEKIRAGASLVQLYTALVFEGPSLITRIKADIVEQLGGDKFTTVKQAVGGRAEEIAMRQSEESQ